MISDIINRIIKVFSDENTEKDAYYTTISKSFIISADVKIYF
jgi:aspartyl aminopeptidase